MTVYLRKVKKAAAEAKDPSLVFFGDLKAGHQVPFGKVFDVMECFADATIPCVNTAETFMSIPSLDVRDAKRLPYPAKKRD